MSNCVMVDEQRDSSNAICPYCKYTHGDMWEISDEGGIILCDGCGKKFKWRREISVDYITECDCKDNGEEHDFEVINDFLRHEKSGRLFKVRNCKKCTQHVIEYGS